MTKPYNKCKLYGDIGHAEKPAKSQVTYRLILFNLNLFICRILIIPAYVWNNESRNNWMFIWEIVYFLVTIELSECSRLMRAQEHLFQIILLFTIKFTILDDMTILGIFASIKPFYLSYLDWRDITVSNTGLVYDINNYNISLTWLIWPTGRRCFLHTGASCQWNATSNN